MGGAIECYSFFVARTVLMENAAGLVSWRDARRTERREESEAPDGPEVEKGRGRRTL
jgi:hypothetical protein